LKLILHAANLSTTAPSYIKVKQAVGRINAH
jgi:hypothetical protein